MAIEPTHEDAAFVLASIQQEQDQRALWGWIRAQFGVELPCHAYTPNHSTPFDFVADAFFNPGKNVAAWASRSGGKTLGGGYRSAHPCPALAASVGCR